MEGRKTFTVVARSATKEECLLACANYLSVGQICLYGNPLLREPLKLSHVKPLVVGHWGTTPGQNFIYVHLNRVIKKYDLDMISIAGPLWKYSTARLIFMWGGLLSSIYNLYFSAQFPTANY